MRKAKSDERRPEHLFIFDNRQATAQTHKAYVAPQPEPLNHSTTTRLLPNTGDDASASRRSLVVRGGYCICSASICLCAWRSHRLSLEPERGRQIALSKSQNLIFGTFWPGKSGKAEKKIRKNPLTNTSNNKLGHWYLYFNPCSVKLGEGLTSFGTHDDVIDP